MNDVKASEFLDSKQLKLSKSIRETNIDRLSTGTILWILVKKHKFFLVSSYALILTLYFMGVAQILTSLVSHS